MGKFLQRVRNGVTPAPTTAKWRDDVWKRDFDGANPHDERDVRLFAAGRWFALKLASLRALAPDLGVFGLEADKLVRVAIAGVNRDWLIAEEQLISSTRAESLVLADKLFASRLETSPLGIKVDFSAYFEAAVDCMRHLVSAGKSGKTANPQLEKVVDAIVKRTAVSNAYFVVEELWRECLWDDWEVVEGTEFDLVRPTDVKNAISEKAAEFRQRSVQYEQMDGYIRLWSGLSEQARELRSRDMTVAEIRHSGKYREIILGTPKREQPDLVAARWIAASGRWLDHLRDAELPRLPGVTPIMLFRAWDFVHGLALATLRRMPQNTGVVQLSQLWAFAPAIDKNDMRMALMRAMRVDGRIAMLLLETLTMSTLRNSDIWLTPLWSTNSVYYVLTPVALISSPQRLLEHWLTLGGVPPDVRGPLFEQYIRESCREAIEESSLLGKVARCSPSSIELDVSIGDIDLVVLIGNTVLVAECKSTQAPGTAVERANYSEVLHGASEQVLRKVNHARDHVEELANATGWDLTKPDFVPVIITDQRLGVGRLIDGVPVVDDLILTRFLREGFIERGVVIDADGTKNVLKKVYFYENEADAEAKLKTYLAAPPQLQAAWSAAKVTEMQLLVGREDKPAFYRSIEIDVEARLAGVSAASSPSP